MRADARMVGEARLPQDYAMIADPGAERREG
jgi:hypothetical protein